MKVLHAGIFEDHELGGDVIFEKGLLANGCAVTRFPYVPGQPIDHAAMVEAARGQDLVLIGKGEGFSRAALAAIRKAGAQVAIWYGDIRAEPEGWLLDLMPETDVFFMSSGGATLKAWHDKGKPRVSAFYLNPVDPDLVERYRDLPSETRDVVFTATNYPFAGSERKAATDYLRARTDTTVIGWAQPRPFLQRYFPSVFGSGEPPTYVRGADYIAYLKSAKIGVGVSALQNVPRYSSDRLQHYITFGTFFLPWKFPDIELFFDYGKDLVWFAGVDDLAAKLDHYLREPEERRAIAKRAQEKFLTMYNSEAIVAMMLDIVRDGTSHRVPWVEVHR